MVATRSKTAPPGPRPRPGPRTPPRADFPAHPSEEDLLTSFLLPRALSGGGDNNDSNRPGAPFIHDVDVYSAGPGELTGGLAPAVASNGDRAWYFFSAVRAKTRDGQRKARTVDSGGGGGCWHSEAGSKPVVEGEGKGLGGRILGHRQGFSFVTKVDGRRVRSGWLMVELSLDGADADDLVLCKIYFSPRARVSASPSPSSSSSGSKRKAAAEDDKKNPANSARQQQRRGTPTETEAEAGTATPNNAQEKDNAGELWTDDSGFSWWIRNRDWFMETYNFVDRSDEELQKTLGLDEYLRMLKHHYTDFGRGHAPVLNS